MTDLNELAQQLEQEARDIEGDSDSPLRVAVANKLYEQAATLRARAKEQSGE
jgi:hypothetical protein